MFSSLRGKSRAQAIRWFRFGASDPAPARPGLIAKCNNASSLPSVIANGVISKAVIAKAVNSKGRRSVGVSCAICNERKEKRFCPAIHGRICPQCCGEQREVTLDCPSDCVYLQQARAHEKPRRAEEHDAKEFFWQVEVDDAFWRRHEHLITGLAYALVKSVRQDRALVDRDLTATLIGLAERYQTLVNSSLYYETPTTNVAHQRIADEIARMVDEFRQAEQQQLGAARLHDEDVLKTVVFLLRTALVRSNGRPKSRAFVDFLFGQFPEKSGVETSAEEAGKGRIIVP